MPSLRDIRRRIASVKSTQKITKAMQVVAATRLRRAQEQVKATRPYAEKMLEVLQTTAERAGEYKHPFLVQRDGKKVIVILITTDRGLCGALNVNTIRALTRYVNENHPEGARYATIGRKGRDFMLRFRREVVADSSGISDRPRAEEVLPTVFAALDEFRAGRADTVLLAYAKWISTMKQQPVVRTLVPVAIPEREKDKGVLADYIYEPEPEAVLDALLPAYVETQVYQAVLENKASEFSAKMIAMQNATNAAKDLVKALDLFANKVRQSSITSELLEIVSGAEALKAG